MLLRILYWKRLRRQGQATPIERRTLHDRMWLVAAGACVKVRLQPATGHFTGGKPVALCSKLCRHATL